MKMGFHPSWLCVCVARIRRALGLKTQASPQPENAQNSEAFQASVVCDEAQRMVDERQAEVDRKAMEMG